MSQCTAKGPFYQTTFLGASVTQFNARVGWGSDSSELSVDLAEDLCEGNRLYYDIFGNATVSTYKDFFSPPLLGSPLRFKFCAFEFSGILESWDQTKSIEGGTGYNVTLKSPTQILGGAKVILKGYQGESTANIFNLSDWCNDAGVTWTVIRSALHMNAIFYLRGRSYKLDLSSMGNLDLRFTGDSVNVLECIMTAAKNLGGKVYFDLCASPLCLGTVLDTIKVHFARTSAFGGGQADFVDSSALLLQSPVDSRLALGIIQNWAGSSTCTDGVIRQVRGIERSETISNALLVGDNIQALWGVWDSDRDTVDAESQDEGFSAGAYIKPFWGLDRRGNPRIGEGDGNEHSFELDVSREVFDMGVPVYDLTVGEMRAALDSYDTWLIWFELNSPAEYATLAADADAEGLIDMEACLDMIQGIGPGGAVLGAGVGADGDDFDALNAKRAVNTKVVRARQNAREAAKEKQDPLRSFYSLVQGIAEEFYGKKWAVALPQLKCCAPQPGNPIRTKTSWEQTDGGWTNNRPVLGLQEANPEERLALDMFKIDDGRVGPILYYTSELDLAVEEIQTPYYAKVDKHHVWVQATFEKIILACTDDPVAIIATNGAVMKSHVQDGDEALPLAFEAWEPIMMQKKANRVANVGVPALLLDPNAAAPAPMALNARERELLIELLKKTAADRIKGFGMAPLFESPDGAAVPLKSNTMSYGPWSASGPDATAGQASYERNTNLNPWTYGSTSSMNTAAGILVNGTISNQPVSEQGSISVAGAPVTSRLGDVLRAGGPNLTGIDVSVTMGGGVTTSYRIKTYIRNFGELAKSRVDWMQQVAQGQQAFQRALQQRAIHMRQVAPKGSWQRNRRREARHDPGSSHLFTLSELVLRDPDTGTNDLVAAITSFGRCLPEMGADNDAVWVKKAGVSHEGLFRPFDTKNWDDEDIAAAAEETGDAAVFPHFEVEQDADASQGGGEGSELGVDGEGIGANCTPSLACPPTARMSCIGITGKNLSPYLNKQEDTELGTSVGHDIEYVIRDDKYPDNLSIRLSDDVYGETYRPMGLRGPLVLVGWGFDIDGYPVPNKNEGYPGNRDMEFKENWLSKTQDWKAGPVDLRWDYERKVWTGPPTYKIVRAKLGEDLIPVVYGGNGYASGNLDEPKCSGSIFLNDYLHQPINTGSRVLAYFDPDTCEYTVLQAQFRPMSVVTDICAGPGSGWVCGSACSGDTFYWEAYTRNIYVQTAISPPTGTPVATGIMLAGPPRYPELWTPGEPGQYYGPVDQEC